MESQRLLNALTGARFRQFSSRDTLVGSLATGTCMWDLVDAKFCDYPIHPKLKGFPLQSEDLFVSRSKR